MNAKSKIIEEAVNKLKKFGFVNVSADNITEDEVYRYFFEKILADEIGKNNERAAAIGELLKKLEAGDNLNRKK